jgi:hypothetical protein
MGFIVGSSTIMMSPKYPNQMMRDPFLDVGATFVREIFRQQPKEYEIHFYSP